MSGSCCAISIEFITPAGLGITRGLILILDTYKWLYSCLFYWLFCALLLNFEFNYAFWYILLLSAFYEFLVCIVVGLDSSPLLNFEVSSGKRYTTFLGLTKLNVFAWNSSSLSNYFSSMRFACSSLEIKSMSQSPPKSR